MTKRRNARKLGLVDIILLFLVVAGFCFMVVFMHGSEVGEKDLDVSGDVPGNQEIEQMEHESEYLILVNKTHGLEPNYEPEDLVKIDSRAEDRATKYQKMRAVPAAAFNEMTSQAKAEGYIIKITTGYRPYDYQKTLHDQYLREKGDAWTEQYSAEPGFSEHQTGLAADVSGESIDFKLQPDFAESPEGQWIAENAHKFGFIVRYQKGKEGITGYAYEPWHIRYVGVDAATEIYNGNLTLEEYLGDI